MSTSISRAAFLRGMAALAAAGLCGTTVAEIVKKAREQARFPCRMLGPSKDLGHLLRDPSKLAGMSGGTSKGATSGISESTSTGAASVMSGSTSKGAASGISESTSTGAASVMSGSTSKGAASGISESTSRGQPGSQPGGLSGGTAGSVTAGKPETRHCRVAIVGGGIAGLSAAWWLDKQGIRDFMLLELEKEVGGNASCGKNQFGAYPWGAHYVPIPNRESTYVRQLMEELKILQSYNEKGAPVYDELMLCHEPQERLWKDGAFHEGLVPKRGLQKEENEEIGRFFSRVVAFRNATGNDGKPAFAIPLDLSSEDPLYRNLDKITMRQWLSQNDFKSAPLLWYVNYCCRDDYGSTLDNVSAWAGIHYFAGRRGTAANAEQNAVLTWPQGNGFLVEQLRSRLGDYIHTNCLVTRVKRDGDKVITDFVSAEGLKGTISSEHVIFAAPRFIAKHIIDDNQFQAVQARIGSLNYAPWLVANISLKNLPAARGVAPAWDNVSYYSDSLGYVMADHQEITTRQKPCVITYYYPLSQDAPKKARSSLYQSTAREWSDKIIKDLEKVHPGIAAEVISMDLWPWGHGMIRPDVGYIWGERRRLMKQEAGNIAFAHSDMSGISNFEEAQYHGVEAAKSVIDKLHAGGAKT